MATKKKETATKKYWATSVTAEDGRSIQLFEWRSQRGESTIYYTVKDERLACGYRTRSLRHGDREKALEWAQGILDSGISLDEIPDVSRPQKKEVKKSTTKKAAKKPAKQEPTIKDVLYFFLSAPGTEPSRTDQRRAQMFAAAVGGEAVSGWSEEGFRTLRATGAINPLGESVPEADQKPVSAATVRKDIKWLEKVLETVQPEAVN